MIKENLKTSLKSLYFWLCVCVCVFVHAYVHEYVGAQGGQSVRDSGTWVAHSRELHVDVGAETWTQIFCKSSVSF